MGTPTSASMSGPVAHAIERRECRAQHMIKSIGGVPALQRQRSATSATTTMIAPSRRGSVHTVAWILGIDITAGLADLDLVDRHLQCTGQRRHQRFGFLIRCHAPPPRRTRAEPRQPRQQLDQAFDFGPATAEKPCQVRAPIPPAANPIRRSTTACFFRCTAVGLALRVVMRGHQKSSRISRSSAFISDGSSSPPSLPFFGGHAHADKATARDAFDLDMAKLFLHGLHLRFALGRCSSCRENQP